MTVNCKVSYLRIRSLKTYHNWLVLKNFRTNISTSRFNLEEGLICLSLLGLNTFYHPLSYPLGSLNIEAQRPYVVQN